MFNFIFLCREVKRLVGAGADPNGQTDAASGITPMHWVNTKPSQTNFYVLICIVFVSLINRLVAWGIHLPKLT